VPVAGGAAAASLVFCFGFWFGLTLWLRARRRSAEPAGAVRRKAA